MDYFGDGSLYLLDSPGHAIGHLCGLVRTTTSPNTFILMGGDACHYPGQFRPSSFRPIPESIETHHFSARFPSPCPGDLFETLQTSRGRKKGQAFYDQAIAEDLNIAAQTVCKVQEADTKDHIWVVIAHDQAVQRTVELFPASANDWKQKGWNKATRWAFLKDFEAAVDI
jgi:glyoxylase-like metal-dependent hydrolase (beta-lactamase superfamily II)